MLDRVLNLAQFIKAKKARGEKFVLMLGAGASLSSGVKTTRVMMEELVTKYLHANPTNLDDQFDRLWEQSTRGDRLLMLEPYLDHVPSEGYRQLADLISKEYFDLVITFNFDRLLERALDEANFRDYKTIIRGETSTDAISAILAGAPRVKILKMHGSLQSANYFLFSKEEMLNYPPDLERLISDITGRDIIISGYAFNDMCVMRAFNTSKDAGSIYFVNPSGAVDNIKGFLVARRSQDKVIGGDIGAFDPFMNALYEQLCAPPALAVPLARHNLFKFLDYYQEDQKSWFVGRRKLTRKLLKQFDAAPAAQQPAVLWMSGEAKVGKTSFVRAGLIPYLDPARFEPIYVRCTKTASPDTQLRAELARRFPTLPDGQDWPTTFARLAELTPRRIMIVLDQFERPSGAAADVADKQKALLDFVNALVGQANERLMVVFVGAGQTFWKLMAYASPHKRAIEEIPALSSQRVSRIIRYAARKGGVPLDPAMIATLCDEYQKSLADTSDRHPFTLMHVQTICYYLARGFQQTWEGADRLPQSLTAALDSIRDDASLLDVFDDITSDERRVIRSFLKVICDPSANTRKIIAFIRNHFPEIKEDRFPEPIV